jgi:transposase-like protein
MANHHIVGRTLGVGATNPDRRPREFLRRIVERTLQQLLLEAEITEHVGAAPYQRTESRKGHRDGYKPRKLKTRVGTLELLVPQDLKRVRSPPGFSPATNATRRLWS